MAWQLGSELSKLVKDDQEYCESELFEAKKSDTNNDTEEVENVEGMEGPERKQMIDENENVR